MQKINKMRKIVSRCQKTELTELKLKATTKERMWSCVFFSVSRDNIFILIKIRRQLK